MVVCGLYLLGLTALLNGGLEADTVLLPLGLMIRAVAAGLGVAGMVMLARGYMAAPLAAHRDS